MVIRIGEDPASRLAARRAVPLIAPGTAQDVTIEKWGSIYGSTIHIGVPGLYCDVFERLSPDARTVTTERMDEFVKYVDRSRQAADAISVKGFCDAIMPPKPTQALQSDTITISERSHPMVEFWGWVNAGESGLTTVRFFDADSNKEHFAATDGDSPSERTGWSTDSGARFFVGGEVVLHALRTGFSSRHRVRAEMWFTPDGRGEPRKLAEVTQTVEGWER